MSADDGSLSNAINKHELQATRTLPKPDFPLELRQIFGRFCTPAQVSPKSKYLPQVLQRAMRNFEKFYGLEQGASNEELIDQHSLTVVGWAESSEQRH